MGNLNQIASYTRAFFRFLQGLTDFQDRILPLLANNSFNYGISHSEKREECLIEDEICL